MRKSLDRAFVRRASYNLLSWAGALLFVFMLSIAIVEWFAGH